MPWLTFEVSQLGQQSIGHVALHTYPLYVTRLVDCRSLRYGYTNIQLHAASYSCWFWFYGRFFNVHPESDFWWLQWQPSGGIPGVSAAAVCQRVPHWMFKLIKCTNLDIEDTACLHIIHILQHPTSHPTTWSTHSTIVNAPNKTFRLVRLANTVK